MLPHFQGVPLPLVGVWHSLATPLLVDGRGSHLSWLINCLKIRAVFLVLKLLPLRSYHVLVYRQLYVQVRLSPSELCTQGHRVPTLGPTLAACCHQSTLLTGASLIGCGIALFVCPAHSLGESLITNDTYAA